MRWLSLVGATVTLLLGLVLVLVVEQLLVLIESGASINNEADGPTGMR